jgi:hypothetical protein
MNALVVHGMAFSNQKHMKAPVPILRPLGGELPQPPAQGLSFCRHLATVGVGGTMKARHRAGTHLAGPILLPEERGCLAPGRRALRFAAASNGEGRETVVRASVEPSPRPLRGSDCKRGSCGGPISVLPPPATALLAAARKW